MNNKESKFNSSTTSKIVLSLVVLVLVFFGLLTLFLSSSIIFDLFGIREKEGNYVLFIVWTNFICSLIYLSSVYGFIKRKKWTFPLLVISLAILMIVFLWFLEYINSGGLYETKTIGAMIFRILMTFGFTSAAYYFIKKRKI